MAQHLAKRTATEELTIGQGESLSDELEMSTWVTLLAHMSDEWTSASLGFKTASETGGTFQPLRDDDGNLVQIDSPSASNDYTAPAEVAAVGYLKLWSQNGSGANTTQGGARTITVTLTS